MAHVNPLASIANELAQRGHTVAFVSYGEYRASIREEVKFLEIPVSEAYARFLDSEINDPRLSTVAALVAAWQERLIPLCKAMLPNVERFAREFEPDLIVTDQHALAGSITARKLNIPWVTSAPSASLIADKLPDEINQGERWKNSLLDELQVECGLPPIEHPDESPLLVLIYSSRKFAGESNDFPAQYRFVGANIAQRLDTTEFPWDELSASVPKIYVSFGTIIGKRADRILGVCVQALADQPVQVIVSDPASVLENVPDNFIVRPWVPQIALLPKIDLVVTHGGSSVNEALAFGKPVVVAPYHLDNYIYAAKVRDANIGLQLRFGRVGPIEFRRTVFEALETPVFREAAEGLSTFNEASGGTRVAADEIEQLLMNPVGEQP